MLGDGAQLVRVVLEVVDEPPVRETSRLYALLVALKERKKIDNTRHKNGLDTQNRPKATQCRLVKIFDYFQPKHIFGERIVSLGVQASDSPSKTPYFNALFSVATLGPSLQ